jgi:glycine/D-amino acid oxidase-like deaminating enzyme
MVDCDLWIGDTLDVPMTPEVASVAKDVFEDFKAAGGKIDHIKITHDPVEAAKISRIKDAHACYAWPASTLQPWKLTAHIMRDNLKNGVNLQTNTIVTQITQSRQSPGKWIVESERGKIECMQVVHATNAYSSALEPSLRGLISPSPHICNRVVPPVEYTGSKGLQNSYGVLMSDGDLFSINPRSTSDGLVMFGGSNPGQGKFEKWLEEHPEKCVDDSLLSFESVSDAIQDFTESQFPGWASTASGGEQLYKDGWSGVIALVSEFST